MKCPVWKPLGATPSRLIARLIISVLAGLIVLVNGVAPSLAASDVPARAVVAPYGTQTGTLVVGDATPCVNTDLSVAGSAYPAGATVQITIDGAALTTVAASATGTFAVSVPLGAFFPGAHTVTGAADDQGAHAWTSFEIVTCASSPVATDELRTASTGGSASTTITVVAILAAALLALSGGVVLVGFGRRRR